MEIELQFILQEAHRISKPKFKRGDIKRRIYHDLYDLPKKNVCFSKCYNRKKID